MMADLLSLLLALLLLLASPGNRLDEAVVAEDEEEEDGPKLCKTRDLTSFLMGLDLCSFLPASILLITASHRPFFLGDLTNLRCSFSFSSFVPDSIIAFIFETTFLFGILYFFRAAGSCLLTDFGHVTSFTTSMTVVSTIPFDAFESPEPSRSLFGVCVNN